MNARTVAKLEEVRVLLEGSPKSFIYSDIADDVHDLIQKLNKKLEWLDKHGDEYKNALSTKHHRQAHLQYERGVGSALHGLEILWKSLERIDDVVG